MEDISAQTKNSTVNDTVPKVLQTSNDTDKPQKKINTTRFVLIILGILAILSCLLIAINIFFAQSSTGTSTKKVTYTGSVEKIRIGNVGVYSIFNLLAEEKGFFADNGLDAKITEFSSGPESMAGLLAGKTDINIAADFVGVRNIFDHPELRILAQANQHRIFQLAAKKDRIATPQDLKGKKIGVTKNSAGEYFLGNFLSANNLKLEDVTRVDLTPLDMITQVENGKIDGMVVFEPHVYNLKKKIGQNFISWNIQGDQNISALVYTTQAFIDKNPEIVQRYLKALVDAETYYETHVDETKEMVAKKLSYEREYIDYSWPKLTHHITLNQELILGMEDEARWTIENKLTDKTIVPNYLENIYFDGLSIVKPDAVTIIR